MRCNVICFRRRHSQEKSTPFKSQDKIQIIINLESISTHDKRIKVTS
jgi:hypothetical protein